MHSSSLCPGLRHTLDHLSRHINYVAIHWVLVLLVLLFLLLLFLVLIIAAEWYSIACIQLLMLLLLLQICHSLRNCTLLASRLQRRRLHHSCSQD